MMVVMVVGNLDTMSDFIQGREINWSPDIFNRSFGVRRDQNFVLSRVHFIGCQNADLSPGHFLLMNRYSLGDVVDLGLHFGHLSGLQVQHVEQVVGQGVDLICNGGQGLRRVVFGLLESRPLVVGL